jgi:hypothetical protein
MRQTVIFLNFLLSLLGLVALIVAGGVLYGRVDTLSFYMGSTPGLTVHFITLLLVNEACAVYLDYGPDGLRAPWFVLWPYLFINQVQLWSLVMLGAVSTHVDNNMHLGFSYLAGLSSILYAVLLVVLHWWMGVGSRATMALKLLIVAGMFAVMIYFLASGVFLVVRARPLALTRAG